MSRRQRRLARVAAAACVGAAGMTFTMAVPAAAASGPEDCPGLDLRDPLASVKCPVDEVTRRVLPSNPASSVPTTAPAPVPTSAPAARQSGGDRPPTTRPAPRPAPGAAVAPADGKVRRGTGNGGPAPIYVPPIPTTVQLPYAEPSYPYIEPSYPYPEVIGDTGRSSIRAAAAAGTDARTQWTSIATALVLALCAGHVGVVTRRLRQETDR